MEFILNGNIMTDRGATHDHLAEQLELPAYYGRNLDALYDVLMELSGEIVLQDPAAVTGHLGRYGEALLATMQEAAENNPHLSFTLK